MMSQTSAISPEALGTGRMSLGYICALGAGLLLFIRGLGQQVNCGARASHRIQTHALHREAWGSIWSSYGFFTSEETLHTS
jgi:hypothetical protein